MGSPAADPIAVAALQKRREQQQEAELAWAEERRLAQLRAQKMQGMLMLAIAVCGFIVAQYRYPEVSFLQLSPIAATAAPGILALFGTIAVLHVLTRLIWG